MVIFDNLVFWLIKKYPFTSINVIVRYADSLIGITRKDSTMARKKIAFKQENGTLNYTFSATNAFNYMGLSLE